MTAPTISKGAGETAKLFARMREAIILDIQADGKTTARFPGYAVELGTLGADAAARAQELGDGLALDAFAAATSDSDKELSRLVRRLAAHGFLEYRLARGSDGADEAVIEPLMPDYWPRLPALDDDHVLVLSRFAYLRRRADDLVLESPRAGALFRICDPEIAAGIARLASPQPVKALRREDGGLGDALLALLTDCRILFRSIPRRRAICALPRETTTSCCGTFTISCSTRARPRAGMLIRWVGLIPMPP